MIVIVGEGMLELSGADMGWRLDYGGDTLNTAIHLARLGHRPAFVSALGTDPFSASLRTDWADAGLDLSLLRTDPERRPALYAITTDAEGERSFTYWRSDSAARRMFALCSNDDLEAAAAETGLLYFSMITLAILPPIGRETLFEVCRRVRAHGGRVAFDSNYRPTLWENADAARVAHAAALSVSDIGLPTLDDEQRLSGVSDAGRVADAWREAGVAEVVVKLGADGCLVDGAVLPVPTRVQPRDTTGAGDAFNAGYLHGRLARRAVADSVVIGHRLAGWAITERGGIPAITPAAPYAALA